MSLSPLRPLAAPVQDAPRKLSTPQPPAQRQSGLHQSGLHRSTEHAGHRRSNPALQSATGASGFDGRPQLAGKPQLADSRPQLSLPGSPDSPSLLPGGRPGGAEAASGTQATGAVPPPDAVHKVFDHASKVMESMLSSLGYKDLPAIEDSTERMKQRSDFLGGLLTATPELADQISTSDKAQLWGLSQLMNKWAPSLPEVEQVAIQSVDHTMRALGWQPPQS